MSTITEERRLAATLPEGDVIAVLLEQHARIRELFDEIERTYDTGERTRVFDELRRLLAVHEAAEEMVLRPVSRRVAADGVVEARNREESDAARVLQALEQLDVTDPQWEPGVHALRQEVEEHADAEEREEFNAVIDRVGDAERRALGLTLQAVEKVAPTHPHPEVAGSSTAQLVAGPFASMLDRAKDLFSKSG